MDDFKTLKVRMDDHDKGVVCIDEDGIIRMCNEKAKLLTGIVINVCSTHEKGTVRDGDIVVIADSKLGADDGRLSTKDLELLNIKDKNIKENDILLAVGVYKNSKIQPEYKHFREHQTNAYISLNTNYLGFNISVSINPDKKETEISLNSRSYKQAYRFAVGNMVIIDGLTGAVKFFQAKGYSTRKEDLGNLLRGGHYREKVSENNSIEAVGKKYLDLFDKSPLSDKLFAVLGGVDESIYDKLYEINKRLFVCSIISIQEDGKTFVFLVIQDVESLEKLLNDRNEMIRQVEESHASCFQSGKPIPENAFEEFVGRGDRVNEVKYMAYKASQNKFNVIITGESGTGKSRIAREIHSLWKKDAPFVEVNCNSIAPTLFESELFGYVGGAFTGAKSDGKIGFFESANGGTIFLDEIGDIPLEIQTKLLHVLQTKKIYRVGSSKEINVNARVIAATNKDLEEEVLNGRFRKDLFYRMTVFPIHIPPLRERKSDIYLLINYLVKRICDFYNIELKQFSGDALHKLVSYNWPGNVRELENVIERAVALCDSSIIYAEHLHIKSENSSHTLKSLLTLEEKRIIEMVLIKNKGNKTKAMKELGLSKTAFYEKIKKFDLL